MNKEKFETIKNKLLNHNSLLKFSWISVIVITVIQSMLVLNIYKGQQTVIKTINQSSQFWITKSDAKEEYLIDLGLDISQYWQNVTPANVDRNFSKILEFVSGNNYSQIKEFLKKKTYTVKRYNRNSYRFQYTKTEVNKAIKEIIITGIGERWTQLGKQESKKKKLIIGYEINNSLFEITTLKEIDL